MTDYVAYPNALGMMERRVDDIIAYREDEQICLLEHPSIYTAGTSAKTADLLTPDRFPIFNARRGGQYTYHGPGQRVVYTMLDLRRRGKDVRKFIHALEGWVIASLADFGIKGERHAGEVGVWVVRYDLPKTTRGSYRKQKISAIGIRLRKWVSFHGISINVHPNLSHYEGIIPCGIAEHGVTSLMDLGVNAQIEDVDHALKRHFSTYFDKIVL